MTDTTGFIIEGRVSDVTYNIVGAPLPPAPTFKTLVYSRTNINQIFSGFVRYPGKSALNQDTGDFYQVTKVRRDPQGSTTVETALLVKRDVNGAYQWSRDIDVGVVLSTTLNGIVPTVHVLEDGSVLVAIIVDEDAGGLFLVGFTAGGTPKFQYRYATSSGITNTFANVVYNLFDNYLWNAGYAGTGSRRVAYVGPSGIDMQTYECYFYDNGTELFIGAGGIKVSAGINNRMYLHGAPTIPMTFLICETSKVQLETESIVFDTPTTDPDYTALRDAALAEAGAIGVYAYAVPGTVNASIAFGTSLNSGFVMYDYSGEGFYLFDAGGEAVAYSNSPNEFGGRQRSVTVRFSGGLLYCLGESINEGGASLEVVDADLTQVLRKTIVSPSTPNQPNFGALGDQQFIWPEGGLYTSSFGNNGSSAPMDRADHVTAGFIAKTISPAASGTRLATGEPRSGTVTPWVDYLYSGTVRNMIRSTSNLPVKRNISMKVLRVPSPPASIPTGFKIAPGDASWFPVVSTPT